ncbi:MAG: hypothetical protein M1541_19860, partial [Acidobacteria bacterium]|nr:hypothetical protein [Acidobacteriota bacterium]
RAYGLVGGTNARLEGIAAATRYGQNLLLSLLSGSQADGGGDGGFMSYDQAKPFQAPVSNYGDPNAWRLPEPPKLSGADLTNLSSLSLLR